MYEKLTKDQLKAGFDILRKPTTAREYANVIYWQIEDHVKDGHFLGALMILLSSIDFMAGRKKKDGDKKFARWLETYMSEYLKLWGEQLEHSGVTRPTSADIWDLRCAMFHETSGTELGFHTGLFENMIFMTNQSDIKIKSLIDAPAFIKAFYSGLFGWVEAVETEGAEYQPFTFPFAVIVRDRNDGDEASTTHKAASVLNGAD